MIDTNEEMHRKQLEVIYAKSPEERFIIGGELIELGRYIVENSIKLQNPDLSELDLKIEVLKRYYSQEFSPEELNKIISSLINYYEAIMINQELI